MLATATHNATTTSRCGDDVVGKWHVGVPRDRASFFVRTHGAILWLMSRPNIYRSRQRIQAANAKRRPSPPAFFTRGGKINDPAQPSRDYRPNVVAKRHELA
jgi:hypothetical protein